MNKGMLSVGIIILGLIALNLLNVLNGYSTGSELDYYLLKETSEAAMVDALDKSFLRTCGLYRIDREKYIESFYYRFISNVDATRGYRVRFYDINEVPPKVSVMIDSLTSLSFNVGGENPDKVAANISTSYDGILEARNIVDVHNEVGLNTDNDMCKSYFEANGN